MFRPKLLPSRSLLNFPGVCREDFSMAVSTLGMLIVGIDDVGGVVDFGERCGVVRIGE